MEMVAMRCLRLLIAIILLGASPARADNAPSPEALQAANELFTVVSGDMLQQLIGQISGAFWPSVEQSARAEKIDDATIAELRKEFDRLELAFVTQALKEAPPVYARHFTVDELKDLTAFYRTPLGAKALREMPQVMGEFTAVLVPQLDNLRQQTGEAFNKVLRDHGYLK
jgi:uncharacterized protein